MGEKTEKATPKKLRDARKKGQVAKSQDFPSAFTFAVSISIVLAMVGYLYDHLGAFIIGTFSSIPTMDMTQNGAALFMEGAMVIFMTSMPILVGVSVVGIIVNFLIIGPVFSTEVFKPDIKKFNPVTNIKNKFKMKTLFELLKSLFKVFGAGYLIYGTVAKSLPVLTHTVELDMLSALTIFYYFLMEVVWKVGLFFVVIAVADLAYQKYNFANEMKMEKFEIKQEYKNTEGDPKIKSKRKEIAREIAYSDGPRGHVKKAKAVVTNPTHLAIAIGFEKELDPAPYILCIGADAAAKYIIELAEEFGIPVMRNIPLARDLYERGEEFRYVPEDTYEALAEILRWIESLESGAELDEYEEPES
ncbi:MAG: EscU/YscU/HrcU family type III secretion system export apparatus switch protein [Waddliaceae bacterium]|nr:EscU/YscU/HrcU family type III secretion system export apparatus switch protein [Waddliaceae bacterium]